MKQYKKDAFDHTIGIFTKIFGVFLGVFCLLNIYLETHAEDLLEQAFAPSKAQQTIIDLGATKEAVGNEILRQGQGLDLDIGPGCTVGNVKTPEADIQIQMAEVGYTQGASAFCTLKGGTRGGTNLTTTKQAPLIVRIAKWMLRITIVLSISMVIFNGVMYMIESAKGGDTKDSLKNLGLIVGGILVALLSLGIINLISSITVTTLK